MNKKKITLSEELKKFKLLSEYDFYVPENYKESDDLLGEDNPADDEDSLGDTTDAEFPDDSNSDGPIDFSGEDTKNSEPQSQVQPIEPTIPAQDEEVELDVTELVQGTKDAKTSSDLANQQLARLTQKFDQLLATTAKIEQISQKIDNLEHEVEKRNPTEVEKLEMRSLDSFPFNIKLTDYWSDKEGKYDVMGKDKEPKEYVLTQNDIDNDFNEMSIKGSFDDFEEEDI